MFDDTPRTPRPRPPHKQSTGCNIPPGPAPLSPNIPEFLSLDQSVDHDISDPVKATAKMLGIELDDPELSPTTITDVSEKSREELANLFLQAEKVIRARESELLLAANLGKTLLETNEALKLRHDALLSRLPVMQLSLSKPTIKSQQRNTSDQWITDDEISALSSTSARPNSSRGSPLHSRRNSNASLFNPTHRRRISASPSALLALSETNEELIGELTRLRAATDTAQREGAARLRKLEQEINGLKAELDTVQRTNTELEERMQSQWDAEQRQLWIQRLQNLRPKGMSEGDYTPPTQDFAPPGQGIEVYDSVDAPRPPPSSSLTPSPSPIDATIRPSNVQSTLNSPYSNTCASPTTTLSSRYSTISQGEYAVVTQLYHKVEELQRANKELASRNRITQRQLAQAERNALEIKRVYDTIREELGADADVQQSDVDRGGTQPTAGSYSPGERVVVTPRTMRDPRIDRSITPRPSSWAFRTKRTPISSSDKNSSASTTSTTKSRRALGNKLMLNGARATNSKIRKPLTDALFIAPPTGSVQSPSPSRSHRPSSSRTSSPSFSSNRPRASSFTEGTRHRSLGSELGSAFQLDKAHEHENHQSDKSLTMNDDNLNTEKNNDDEDHHSALVTLRRILDEEFLLLSMDSPEAAAAAISNDSEKSNLSRRESALQRMAAILSNEYSVVVAPDDYSAPDQKCSPNDGDMKTTVKHSLLVEALMELWIYLQFVVTICFFVYTMVRRGPRKVMGLPPRRRG